MWCPVTVVRNTARSHSTGAAAGAFRARKRSTPGWGLSEKSNPACGPPATFAAQLSGQVNCGKLSGDGCRRRNRNTPQLRHDRTSRTGWPRLLVNRGGGTVRGWGIPASPVLQVAADGGDGKVRQHNLRATQVDPLPSNDLEKRLDSGHSAASHDRPDHLPFHGTLRQQL